MEDADQLVSGGDILHDCVDDEDEDNSSAGGPEDNPDGGEENGEVETEEAMAPDPWGKKSHYRHLQRRRWLDVALGDDQ